LNEFTGRARLENKHKRWLYGNELMVMLLQKTQQQTKPTIIDTGTEMGLSPFK